MRLIVIYLIFFAVGACAGKNEVKIIPQAEMENIIYDLMQTDELITEQKSDTLFVEKEKRSEYYEQVFALHNTTRSAFYNSYEYYQKRPDLHKEIFDSISKKVSKGLKDSIFSKR